MDMGFETLNPILNVGGIYVLFGICIVSMLVALGLAGILSIVSFFKKICAGIGAQFEGGEKYKKKSKSKSKKKSKLRAYKIKFYRFLQSMFFNVPLLLIQESMIQLVVSGLLFFHYPQDL